MTEIVEVARTRSVGLYPMGHGALVLGFGNVRTASVAEGISRVADLLTVP